MNTETTVSAMPVPVHGTPRLSVRESQILGCFERGWTSRDIAMLWGISLSTINTHMQSVLTKLHARTRLHALAISIRNGYLQGAGLPGRPLAVVRD